MASYNDLPAVLTANIFTYLRQERRQPPHAYCIDKLIQRTDKLIGEKDSQITDECYLVMEERDELCYYVGTYIGNVVDHRFFYPYLMLNRKYAYTDGFELQGEKCKVKGDKGKLISWSYENEDMNKKYFRTPSFTRSI